MARVLVTRELPAGGLDPLARHEVIGPPSTARAMSHSDLVESASGVEAIVCLLTDHIDADVIDAGAGRLRVIANVAVGYDNIDVDAARRHGIAVCNTPGVLTETTADLAFLLVLTASRRATAAEADLRAGGWREWQISGYLGRDVHGGTLGLVGYGRIARAVARRAEGFGMRVLHWSRTPTGAPGWIDSLDELLPQVDVLSLHCPGGAETHHLLDASKLRLLPPTAVVVNTARGTVVDEDALAEALEDGRIFAAGLDVYEREPAISARLLAAPNTTLLPHVGSATVQTRTEMARLATSAVAAVLAGEVPPNCVVAPG